MSDNSTIHYVRCDPEKWQQLKVLAASRRRKVGDMLEQLIDVEWRKYERRIQKWQTTKNPH